MNAFSHFGKTFSEEDFKRPGSQYRGAPFWAWNTKLAREVLLKQIDVFSEMGLGGFHIHSRTGLGTAYLSDEFMGLVSDCSEHAKALGMYCYLYDEDRWPSGFAGGMVTENRAYAQRRLRFTCVPHNLSETKNGGMPPELLACYVLRFEKGCLAEYKQVSGSGPVFDGQKLWYAYLEIPPDSARYNGYTYVDTLNPAAIKRFTETTHDKYYARFSDDFGESIPSIFTDEPNFGRIGMPENAEDTDDISIPFTADFDDTFYKVYGYSILSKLPELFYELPDGFSQARYHYHDHLAERFAAAYADTIGNWCNAHGILATGHLLNEPTLSSQAGCVGETMRSYRSFGLPGIDMLCDFREYTTALQARSASHQYGCPGILSELYGVTGWRFDFRGHKLQGDWQAALGVTLRVPHLTWVSMAGEAKRDYPASIGAHSPWYKEYPLIEDHFARVNTALTSGKAVVHIGVIHPVESIWLFWGDKSRTDARRSALDRDFVLLPQWLLFEHIDFDYICESTLPAQYAGSTDGLLHVGEMAYDAVIVSGCVTLRKTTVSILNEFADKGGTVVFAGELPACVDALPDSSPAKLASKCIHVPYERQAICAAVSGFTDFCVACADPVISDSLISALRRDGDNYYLFVCNGKKPENTDNTDASPVEIIFKGEFYADILNTLTGGIEPAQVTYINGNTVIRYPFYIHTSLLVRLTPGRRECAAPQCLTQKAVTSVCTPEKVRYTLSEPNVLLLDLAKYAVNGGEARPTEEILRIDDALRNDFGYAPLRGGMLQPYADKDPIIRTDRVTLTFRLYADIPVSGAKLAMENADKTAICLNGNAVPVNIIGEYVDKAISVVSLPVLPAGESLLELEVQYDRRTSLESCYLLGNFGVVNRDGSWILTALPETVSFADLVPQGFPFYGGNIAYHLTEPKAAQHTLSVRIPEYRGALVSVCGGSGGHPVYPVFSPYSAELAPDGSGICDITLFGTRENTFGPLHNTDPVIVWYGPDSWRTKDERWTYRYNFKPFGILKSPEIGLG